MERTVRRWAATTGRYYIGTRVLPREFELDCYFEEITEAQLEQIYRWLRRDTQGE